MTRIWRKRVGMGYAQTFMAQGDERMAWYFLLFGEFDGITVGEWH